MTGDERPVRSSAPFPTGSSTGATGHDVTAWRTTDGLVDVGSSDEPVSGGRGGSSDEPVSGGVGSSDEPVSGGVGSSDEPVSGGGETQRSSTGPGDQTGDRSGDHDVIVGYASDDSAVVVSPGGRTADETAADRPIAPPHAEDVERRPLDIDQERTR